MSKNPKRGFSLDTKKRIFYTSLGHALQLRRWNIAMLENFYTKVTPSIPVTGDDVPDDVGEKPEPPVVEVDYGKGRKGTELNPRDPAYIQELEAYNARNSMAMLKIAFRFGVADDPPPDEIAFWQEMDPTLSKHGVKYQWIMSCLGDDPAEIQAFTQSVMGQELPTDEGIAQATESFRSEGEPEADPVLELAEGAS